MRNYQLKGEKEGGWWGIMCWPSQALSCVEKAPALLEDQPALTLLSSRTVSASKPLAQLCQTCKESMDLVFKAPCPLLLGNYWLA